MPDARKHDNMLDRWAFNAQERHAIADFFEWLRKKYDAESAREGTGHLTIYDIRVEKELDEYHKIDQAQLDRERRALLDEYRNAPSDLPEPPPFERNVGHPAFHAGYMAGMNSPGFLTRTQPETVPNKFPVGSEEHYQYEQGFRQAIA